MKTKKKISGAIITDCPQARPMPQKGDVTNSKHRAARNGKEEVSSILIRGYLAKVQNLPVLLRMKCSNL